MALAPETRLLLGLVVVIAAVVLWQLVGIGRHAEALTASSQEMMPEGEIKRVLLTRVVGAVGLKEPKPNLWVHLSTDSSLPTASGMDLPGGSLSATALDKVPSIELLCAYSTLFHNMKDFNTILVTDADLPLLLPGWRADLTSLTADAQDAVREVAMLRVLYHYGGMLVPSTFAAVAPFAPTLSLPISVPGNAVLSFQVPVVGSGHKSAFAPSARFMYTDALNPTVRTLFEKLSNLSGTQAQVAAFKATVSKHMLALKTEQMLIEVPGSVIGTKDTDGHAVTLSQALNGFHLSGAAIGVLIPDRIFKVRSYGWMLKDTPAHILNGSTWLASKLRAADPPTAQA